MFCSRRLRRRFPWHRRPAGESYRRDACATTPVSRRLCHNVRGIVAEGRWARETGCPLPDTAATLGVRGITETLGSAVNSFAQATLAKFCPEGTAPPVLCDLRALLFKHSRWPLFRRNVCHFKQKGLNRRSRSSQRGERARLVSWLCIRGSIKRAMPWAVMFGPLRGRFRSCWGFAKAQPPATHSTHGPRCVRTIHE